MNDTLRIDSFEAQAVPLGAKDRNLLHELTVGVFWPHRAADLDQLMAVGEGYLSLDEIGRPVGSAMRFPAGDDFAMLGMMVTPPRLQARGGGRFLLRRIIEDCDGRDLRLNATRSGYRLYQEAGFERVRTVFQHQGHLRTVPEVEVDPQIEIVEITPEHHAAVHELDRAAFGADRRPVIDALLGVSTGIIAMRAGQPCGYALVRRFGMGQVLGPLVASSEKMASQIAAPLMRQFEGRFLRVDTPAEGDVLTSFLTASGLPRFDTVTEMRMGLNRRPTEGVMTYGLAAHSLG